MQVPAFKGTRLWDRLRWAKANLAPYQSDYRVVYEDSIDECARVLVPDPCWMACALQGGILPPVWVHHELDKDEAQPGFVKHKRGYLLHETDPVPAMTEEEAIEYLVMKDVPPSVWREYKGNRTVLKIVPSRLIPTSRSYRNAWRITQEEEAA
tara:strand:- start:48 stop:506 length:459 start_codon:yes stop_codon:yes gene_type:complete